ncbi:uncharacterized protein LOC142164210 [Nicotiana tabacum]|uniref:Uncharacterized protein LOC142164210 n=1 Tax=Nicotiana tabacum TaxID=4097 RepID=A0AC58RYA7_TOBAC
MVARVVSLAAPGVSGKETPYPPCFLVMDASSKMMDRAAGGGFLRGFLAPIGMPSAQRVSHLLFVDDTLAFCDADMDQLTYLKQVQQWFQIVSGLKINLGKCEIFPVGEVANIDVLSYVLRCKVGSLPTTYLGLPLGASHKDTTIWNPVIERVEKRFAGWLKRYLSKAERKCSLKALYRIKNAILSAEHSLKESIFGPKKGVQERETEKLAPSSSEKHQKSGG